MFFYIYAVRFYTEYPGMKLFRKRDVRGEKYCNAFLGCGPEESHFVLELTDLFLWTEFLFCHWCIDYGVTSHDIRTSFGHFCNGNSRCKCRKFLQAQDFISALKPEQLCIPWNFRFTKWLKVSSQEWEYR